MMWLNCFKIEKRGYLRPGYFADIVIINPNKKVLVNKENFFINVIGRHLKELSFLAVLKVLLSMEIEFIIMVHLMKKLIQ